MKVEHLIRSDYLEVKPFLGLDSLKKQLFENKALVVIEKEKFLGVITPNDISQNPKTLIIDNISSKPFIDSECSVEKALSLMKKNETNVLPVISNEKLIGLIFKTDLINYISEYSAELETKINERTLELQNTIAMKDMMLSVIAHDLKNPFNSIIGFTDFIMHKIHTYSIDKIEYKISLVNQQAKTTYKLLDNLLKWASSRFNIEACKPIFCDIERISRDVVEQLSTSAEMKKISLNSFHSQDSLAFADKNMVETILRNLISNAIKYTKNGGIIDIYSSANPEHVEITISDNGIGLSQKNKDKLFKTGQNISQIGTSGEIGQGFGLLICKEFVEKNGGTIWIADKKEKGTEFKFTLPKYRH